MHICQLATEYEWIKIKLPAMRSIYIYTLQKLDYHTNRKLCVQIRNTHILTNQKSSRLGCAYIKFVQNAHGICILKLLLGRRYLYFLLCIFIAS